MATCDRVAQEIETLAKTIPDYKAFFVKENGEPTDKQENIAEEDNYELELEPNETDVPESNKSTDDLLVLYITSPSHISFNGLSISKAADEVGMIYGHMNIFHHLSSKVM